MTNVGMNSHTRLFAVFSEEILPSRWFVYIGWIGVYRVMVANGVARFILTERVMGDLYYYIDKDFNDGDGFDIMYGEITDPRDHSAGKVLWAFRNCHMVRQWMPEPVAMMSSHVDALNKWHEFESREWTYHYD